VGTAQDRHQKIATDGYIGFKETVKTSTLNLSAENSVKNTENENRNNDYIVKAQSGEQNNSDLNNSFIYSGHNRRIFLPHSKEVEHP
jgi:hypothetical protein